MLNGELLFGRSNWLPNKSVYHTKYLMVKTQYVYKYLMNDIEFLYLLFIAKMILLGDQVWTNLSKLNIPYLSCCFKSLL